jgi:hypothetical protein
MEVYGRRQFLSGGPEGKCRLSADACGAAYGEPNLPGPGAIREWNSTIVDVSLQADPYRLENPYRRVLRYYNVKHKWRRQTQGGSAQG